MCPIDPSVRPGDCNAIHSALTELRLTLKEHGRALRKLSREQAGLLLVLQTAGEQLARIEAKFGMRPKAGKRR